MGSTSARCSYCRSHIFRLKLPKELRYREREKHKGGSDQMSDLKISDTAKKASRDIAKQVEMQDDPSVTFEHIVQSAINEACRPLVEALAKLANSSFNDTEDRQKPRDDLATHRKMHGP